MSAAPRFPTLRQFRAWVAAHPDGAVVGVAGGYESCPLARCIASSSGRAQVRVETWRRAMRNGVEWAASSLPPWAIRATEMLDAQPGEVTRERALAVLEEVERG